MTFSKGPQLRDICCNHSAKKVLWLRSPSLPLYFAYRLQVVALSTEAFMNITGSRGRFRIKVNRANSLFLCLNTSQRLRKNTWRGLNGPKNNNQIKNKKNSWAVAHKIQMNNSDLELQRLDYFFLMAVSYFFDWCHAIKNVFYLV